MYATLDNTLNQNVVEITDQMPEVSTAEEIFLVSVDTEGHDLHQTKPTVSKNYS